MLPISRLPSGLEIYARALSEAIGDCIVVTIGAGHHIHTSQPDAFVSAVNAFLNSAVDPRR
ncbi:hypothetical protein BH23ACT9_BH23ACT9_23020 [soil metagenome]